MEPWYQYPIVSQFGQIDREGPYWQPDANLAVPWDYPVTELLGGTVTSVQDTDYGQWVVTVKLNTPINSLATHEFYEHLSSASVSQGQTVNVGDLIGYTNNASVGILLGYGFFPGDVYGTDPGWTELQQDLAPGGAGLLNPTAVLNNARENGTTSSTGVLSSSSGGTQNILSNAGIWLAENIFQVNSTVVAATNAASPSTYELIGGIALAAVALLIGFVFVTLTGLV